MSQVNQSKSDVMPTQEIGIEPILQELQNFIDKKNRQVNNSISGDEVIEYLRWLFRA